MNNEKPRRKATKKQVDYANLISSCLNLADKFSTDESLFDVSRFIRQHEKEYKKYIENEKRPASIRQIDYANMISETCNIGTVFSKTSTYEDVSEFIRKYKDNYTNIMRRKSIFEYKKSETSIDVPTESMLFICDNLFKKHGLYSFIGGNGEVLYIGKSCDLSQRILTSYKERQNSAKINKIMYYIDDNMANVNVLEILLIAEYNPILNTESKTEDAPTMFHSGIDILNDFKEIPHFCNNETEVVA